jgi:hypothetical protein
MSEPRTIPIDLHLYDIPADLLGRMPALGYYASRDGLPPTESRIDTSAHIDLGALRHAIMTALECTGGIEALIAREYRLLTGRCLAIAISSAALTVERLACKIHDIRRAIDEAEARHDHWELGR